MNSKSYSMDELTACAADCARSTVARLLERECSSQAAHELLEEAGRALRESGDLSAKDRELLGDLIGSDSAASIHATLQAALEAPLGKPSAEELAMQVGEVALVITSAWIETIRRGVKQSPTGALSLDPILMIPSKDDVGDYLYDKLIASLDSLVIGRDDAPSIMSALREALFDRVPRSDVLRLELPAHVLIERDANGALTATVKKNDTSRTHSDRTRRHSSAELLG